MPKYNVALIVTIEADSYDDALEEADSLAEGIGMREELSVSVATHNRNTGGRGRVVYLYDEIEFF